MENASKALIMAGGILISLLVIGVVVFTFGKINEAQAENQKEREISQIVEYNKRFEQFDKTILYGSDIISIINRADDYNELEANEEVGYEPIKLKIIIEDEIALADDNKYTIKKGTYLKVKGEENKLEKTISIIESKIQSIENFYITKGKPIDVLIDLQLQYENEYNVNYYELGRIDEAENIKKNYEQEMKNYGGAEKIKDDINLYTALNSTLTNFRSKYFTCTDVEYDITGRICEMDFKEATTN